MIKYILIILFLGLCGCNTIQSYTLTPLPITPKIKMFSPEIYTSEQILRMFLESGMVPTKYPEMVDELYVLPTREYIEQVYSPKLEKYLKDLNISISNEGSFDCDDVVRESWALMVREYNKTDHPKNAAILFGQYAFITDKITGHVMNITLINDEYIRNIMFYEPQLQQEVQLSGFERAATLMWGY